MPDKEYVYYDPGRDLIWTSRWGPEIGIAQWSGEKHLYDFVFLGEI